MKFNKNPYALPKNYVFNEIREKAAELKKTSAPHRIKIHTANINVFIPNLRLSFSGILFLL